MMMMMIKKMGSRFALDLHNPSDMGKKKWQVVNGNHCFLALDHANGDDETAL